MPSQRPKSFPSPSKFRRLSVRVRGESLYDFMPSQMSGHSDSSARVAEILAGTCADAEEGTHLAES